jgi:hypothetical protein
MEEACLPRLPNRDAGRRVDERQEIDVRIRTHRPLKPEGAGNCEVIPKPSVARLHG